MMRRALSRGVGCRGATLKPRYNVCRYSSTSATTSNSNVEGFSSEHVSASVLVGKILSQNTKLGQVQTQRPSDSLYDCARNMINKNIGSAIVTGENNTVLGIVTERDYLKVTLDKGNTRDIKLKEIMTPVERISFVEKTDNLQKCMEIMSTKRVRHLPVLEQGQLCGILSIKDVLDAVVESDKKQMEAMSNFVQKWIQNRQQVASSAATTPESTPSATPTPKTVHQIPTDAKLH
eukprot:TRINITY_DN25469_c0_g1_i1.p1 TRINITY_DN25469_c0_g1~~TRINITY_DN25469_c0_g1_i1.p1  ORF type:complete len:234 (+),score=50.02 TRINITY_DN25469_c0_g1_i1:83-784(+)